MAAIAAGVAVIGVAYTIGSEYVNTVVRRSWTYSEWMPTLPWIGTGLAPLAQCFIVPAVALVFAHHACVSDAAELRNSLDRISKT